MHSTPQGSRGLPTCQHHMQGRQGPSAPDRTCACPPSAQCPPPSPPGQSTPCRPPAAAHQSQISACHYSISEFLPLMHTGDIELSMRQCITACGYRKSRWKKKVLHLGGVDVVVHQHLCLLLTQWQHLHTPLLPLNQSHAACPTHPSCSVKEIRWHLCNLRRCRASCIQMKCSASPAWCPSRGCSG